MQWVSTGTDAASRASMLLGGQVDAGLLTAPSYFKLETQGLKVLTELPDHEDITSARPSSTNAATWPSSEAGPRA